MSLSLSELKDRAIRFAQEWHNSADECADAQSFWIDFFHVFDVKQRRVASFEVPIKKADGKQGFTDLLWNGTLLVEHKSRGRDLDRAVDACYRPAAFPTELSRLEFLFQAYRQPPGLAAYPRPQGQAGPAPPGLAAYPHEKARLPG